MRQHEPGQQSDGQAPPRPPRLRNLTTVDFVWAAVVVGTVAYWFQAMKDVWFFIDEWPMADQVRDPLGIFRPYNGHLTITMLTGYRVLLGIFGFSTHSPYRLMGLLAFSSLAVAFYLTSRSRLTPPIAAACSFALLWSPHLSLEAGSFNHSLAMAGGVVCAYGLRGTANRDDLIVAGALVFAFSTSSAGLAVAAAALTHCALRRASLRRWMATAAPTVAWLVWRSVAVEGQSEAVSQARPPLSELLVRTAGDWVSSFSQLSLGHEGLGTALAVAFLVFLAIRLRKGPAYGANMLAWSVGLFVWWFGLEWMRWMLPLDNVYRYDIVSAGMILVALVPDDPIRLPPVPALSWTRHWPAAGAAVVAAVTIAGSHGGFVKFRDLHGQFGQVQRKQSVIVDMFPTLVPEPTDMGLAFGLLTAGDLRTLFTAFGPPEGHGDLERLLTESVTIEDLPPSTAPSDCAPVETLRLGPLASVTVTPGARTAVVDVRRFGSDWVTVAAVAGSHRAKITLRSVLTDEPWELRAPGACVVSG